MASVRWRLLLAEWVGHKGRSLLVVLAMALGTAGAGVVLVTWQILKQVTVEEFRASNPMSASLHTSDVDADLLAAVARVSGVADVQARRLAFARVWVDGAPQTALLTRFDRFDAVRIGKVVTESGAWPPQDGSLVIESSSAGFAKADVGGVLAISVGDRAPVELPVGGMARDVGVAPGWMEHMVYLFATAATLDALGLDSDFDEVQFTVADRSLDRKAIGRIARAVAAVIEASGREVGAVEVPEPGQHIHAAQIGSLLFTQGAFGVLAMVLSCILVANLMNTVLTRQRQQIGVMKAIGARSGQLLSIYLSMAAVLGLLSLAIALPLAWAGGWAYARFMARMLNFDVDGLAVPVAGIASLCAIGLAMPVLAAALPVWSGCRMPVADALRERNPSDAQASGLGGLDRIGWLSRTTRLAIRNAFRSRRRIVLSLLTLAFGGAVSIGASTLQLAVRGAADLMFEPNRFDLVVRLDAAMPAAEFEALARNVDGVAAVEAWSGARAVVPPRGDGESDFGTGFSFTLSGPPAATQLLVPRIVEGRWFERDDETSLVANRGVLEGLGGAKLGDEVDLLIAGQPRRFTVVGILDVAGHLPRAYAPRGILSELQGGTGAASAVVSAQAGSDPVAVVQALRDALRAAGHPVRDSTLMSTARAGIEDHMLMVAAFLGVMGVLMLIVGGMAMASGIGLNVLERTREIGVLRAIGARHGVIFRMIQFEGLVIALLAWLLALPLSLPMSILLGIAFGRIMLPVPLLWLPEPTAMLRWLLVLVIVAVCACAWPAWRAMRIPAQRALGED